MAAIGMRQLRSDLAAALRRAAAGEEMVVTVSGAPVARLGPVTRTGHPGDVGRDEMLGLLVASGAVVAPRRAGPIRPAEPLSLTPHPRLDLLLRDVRS